VTIREASNANAGPGAVDDPGLCIEVVAAIWMTAFLEWEQNHWQSVVPASAWLHPFMLALISAGMQQTWDATLQPRVFDAAMAAVHDGAVSPLANQQLRAALGLQPAMHPLPNTAEVLQEVSVLCWSLDPCCMLLVLVCICAQAGCLVSTW
jgi:hypothetical protein